MARYIKINYNIDLSIYKNQLVDRPGDPRYAPIEVDELIAIVPELGKINTALNKVGWTMFKPKTMTLPAGAASFPHIDSSLDGTPLSLSMNIPIQNGASMTTKWVDIPNFDREEILWRTLKPAVYHEETNAGTIVDTYCVDSMLLDGMYIIKTDEPHTVDGRHSLVPRSMISIRWANIINRRVMTWDQREILLDAINQLN